MRIHVENDIYIQGDGMGYSLVRRSVIQTGEKEGQESFSPLGHYSSVAGCVEHGLLKMKIAASTATNLRELLKEVKAIREEIRAKIDY